jgi:hypothetical protein
MSWFVAVALEPWRSMLWRRGANGRQSLAVLLFAAPCCGFVQKLVLALGPITLPAGMLCWYCYAMVKINPINLASASRSALRRWESSNQRMNRTRVAPVFGHKVQEESALYVLGKHRQRADYLGR